MTSGKPDIQRLLRRHVEGTDAERDAIVTAIATSTVAMELAEQSALKGHELLAQGDMDGVREALAAADRWYDDHKKQVAILLKLSTPPRRRKKHSRKP